MGPKPGRQGWKAWGEPSGVLVTVGERTLESLAQERTPADGRSAGCRLAAAESSEERPARF